ncbi:hypothetical protein Aeqsu_0337 [Aequorivita sublithincola DSM 14238]|uniref:Uncharacterized protein n=1 Tax=Aequorivita sublithincola (strain DSM 14238 / LMG 21431 / ACAM 643 / 9-3) TaxID=746697 RepID=I3YS83_AEQSU|nr:hypothetical protein [Aequorivita sublithincola]AFL79851.1 hypothetical protein Aeqsu_0337 [Aequorivita sublithincola DSM 14238]
MIEFLIGLRQYTVYLIFGLFVIGFISIGLLFKPRYRKKGLIGIGLLFITGFSILGMNFIIASAIRFEIEERAESAMKTNSKIFINGQETNVDSEQFLTDLSKINGWYFTKKSHPETKYVINVISEIDTLDIVLKRDSKNAEEYWTYLPKYKYELELDLLETKVLNGISGEK